ncbi:MAG: hypothetical protein FWE83_11395 [Oscillospiraceae bacterium]|nr:hypothetical protein [Oscillospiraceae bacterium]
MMGNKNRQKNEKSNNNKSSKSILSRVTEFASDPLEGAIKVLDSAIKTTEKLSEKVEENSKKVFDVEPGTGVFVISQHILTYIDKYDVYDRYDNIKYTVKAELTSIRQCYSVFDAEGITRGTVTKKLISLNTDDYIIEVDGKKLGKVNSTFMSIRKYKVSFNGWRIKGNVTGWKYKILCGKTEVADISYKILHNTQVVTFPNKENELIILMLVVALNAASAPSRIERIKNTADIKTSGSLLRWK